MSSSNGAVLIGDYYRNVYRPGRVTKVTGKTVITDDTAMRYFEAFAGRDVPIAEITEALVDRFEQREDSTRGAKYRRQLADRVRAVCRSHDPDRFPVYRAWYYFEDPADELFPPSLTVEDASGDWTLAQMFHQLYIVECLEGRDPKTIVKYHNALTHWEAAFDELPIRKVTRSHLLAFRRYLRAQPGRFGGQMADYTRAGHEKHILRLLQYGDHVGLIEKAPWVKPTRILSTLPKIELGPEQVEKLLTACDRKRRPCLPGVTPGDFWRVFIITAAHTGLRVGSLVALRWEWIEGDVLRVPKEAIKGHHEGQAVALHPQLRAALDAIKHPWPKVFEGIDRCSHNMCKHLRRIAEWAGVEMPPGNCWHAFRRAYINDVCRRSNDPHVAQIVVGHGDITMTAKHYLNGLTKENASLVQQRKVVFARPAIGTTPVREQIDEMRADVEKAQEDLARGDLKAAGWRARCALERYLKRMCRRHNVRCGRRPRLIAMALALAAEDVLSRELVKTLHRVIPTCHKAAHGNKRCSSSCRPVRPYGRPHRPMNS